jgi:hypothetical protein
MKEWAMSGRMTWAAILIAVVAMAGCSSGGSNHASSTTTTMATEATTTTTEAPTTTTTPSPADARAEGSLVTGNASPPLGAGEPGKVSVLGIGPKPGPSDTGFYCPEVVVRNNTQSPITGLNVTVTARGGDGAMLGAADTKAHGMSPVEVHPGHVAFAYVCFDRDLPAGAQFDYAFSEGGSIGPVGLEVGETNSQTSHSNLPAIVGVVKAPTGAAISDSGAWVEVACFDQSGNVLGGGGGYTKGGAPAGGTVPFDVSTLSRCPVYLVAANGYVA